MGLGLKRRAREAAERAFDLIIFPQSDRCTWPEKDYVRRLYSLLRVDCIFDVGANRGQFGRWVRDIGYRGLIVSFEPNPEPFKELQRLADTDGNWICRPQALGRMKGSLALNITKLDVFSSFLAPISTGNFPGENEVVSSIQVEIETLDTVYQELGHLFKRPFLKMDTQGFDLEVIEGGTSALCKFVGLLSEVSIERLYEGSPSIEMSFQTIKTAGFLPAGMFSVHPTKTLKLLEANAYFVRADLAKDPAEE